MSAWWLRGSACTSLWEVAAVSPRSVNLVTSTSDIRRLARLRITMLLLLLLLELDH